MTDKYQCITCGKTFKTNDAVDCFSHGYKVGFLCPFCKSNIIESGDSSNAIGNLKFGFSYALVIFLVFIATRSELSTFISSGTASTKLIILGVLMLLATTIVVYLNRALLFKEKIIYTKKVVPKNNDSR